jgi:hypothetical protein
MKLQWGKGPNRVWGGMLMGSYLEAVMKMSITDTTVYIAVQQVSVPTSNSPLLRYLVQAIAMYTQWQCEFLSDKNMKRPFKKPRQRSN